MFHVELRQFPHNACSFNLTEQELFEQVVRPWSRDEWIELGERKWSPHRARLTVLEWPRLELGDLAMGRGWRSAERSGTDVTEALLAHVREDANTPSVPGATASSKSLTAAAISATPSFQTPAIGTADLQDLLGEDPNGLLAAWRLAAERRPELTPSETLALAERTLGALDGEASS